MSDHRKPWPMKWVVAAIVLVVVPYTLINLRYRKPGPAFQPYEDMKTRANTTRLLAAGYQRVSLVAQRPADGARPLSTVGVAAAPGGLPEELRTTIVDTPLLPTEILHVTAPATTAGDEPYVIQFTCTLPDEKRQLAGADLYIKGGELVLVPDYEKLSGELIARSRASIVQLTIPSGTLKPGRYTVSLVGERTSRTWSLDVN